MLPATGSVERPPPSLAGSTAAPADRTLGRASAPPSYARVASTPSTGSAPFLQTWAERNTVSFKPRECHLGEPGLKGLRSSVISALKSRRELFQVECLQILRDRTVKIVFKDAQSLSSFYNHGLLLNGVNVDLKVPFKPNTRAIVQDLPFHMPAHVITNAFSAFGEVKSVSFRKEVDCLKSGDRVVSFELKEDVPRHLVIGGYYATVFYNGQPPFCEICRGKHLTSKCSLKGKCRRCREVGHFGRNCPQRDLCASCGAEGHVRLDCPLVSAPPNGVDENENVGPPPVPSTSIAEVAVPLLDGSTPVEAVTGGDSTSNTDAPMPGSEPQRNAVASSASCDSSLVTDAPTKRSDPQGSECGALAPAAPRDASVDLPTVLPSGESESDQMSLDVDDPPSAGCLAQLPLPPRSAVIPSTFADWVRGGSTSKVTMKSSEMVMEVTPPLESAVVSSPLKEPTVASVPVPCRLVSPTLAPKSSSPSASPPGARSRSPIRPKSKKSNKKKKKKPAFAPFAPKPQAKKFRPPATVRDYLQKHLGEVSSSSEEDPYSANSLC